MMEKKIPEGYKKTEVGVIPDDWNETEVGKIPKINVTFQAVQMENFQQDLTSDEPWGNYN